MPCSRSPGGGIPACLAGFQAYTQGGAEGSGCGGLQAHTQGGGLLLLAVRILLECILVYNKALPLDIISGFQTFCKIREV